ncbi:MAG: pyrroline-5-carboxylate reductase [Candidatus Saganbacteria bacterium]|nr:pyrroline-5-carboxylate reductase [Candidatus Saganbacteria bacterium]
MATARKKGSFLGVLGVGRMGGALMGGVLSSKVLKPSQISIFDIDQDKVKHAKNKFGVKAAKELSCIIKDSRVVLLAIKPQFLIEVLKEIRPLVSSKQLFISIAAGISLGTLEKALYPAHCVRVMPNNPCLVGEGISAVVFGKGVSRANLGFVNKLFSSVGEVFETDEKFMDVITALSGSGPAFIYNVIEGLVEATEEFNLPPQLALKLAVQMVLGAAVTVKKTRLNPKELREMVTSPGGTTIEGLKVLERREFKKVLAEAIRAAAGRSKELSQEFSL